MIDSFKVPVDRNSPVFVPSIQTCSEYAKKPTNVSGKSKPSTFCARQKFSVREIVTDFKVGPSSVEGSRLKETKRHKSGAYRINHFAIHEEFVNVLSIFHL